VSNNNETSTLPIPCVHGNGTGGRGLREQAKNAYTALGDAGKVMRQAMPHGRDYYPLDKGTPNGPSFLTARKAHAALIAQVEAAQEAYLELAIAIADLER
jgi:hypothetical protein